MSAPRWMQEPDAGHIHKRRPTCIEHACRPVVVIDPDARSSAIELAQAVGTVVAHPGQDISRIIDAIQKHLRSLVATPPPPPEPQGLGAVVENGEGDLFVKWSTDHREGRSWKHHGVSGDYRDWEHINVVRVLSEGWRA